MEDLNKVVESLRKETKEKERKFENELQEA